jgi:hypothetical protein
MNRIHHLRTGQPALATPPLHNSAVLRWRAWYDYCLRRGASPSILETITVYRVNDEETQVVIQEILAGRDLAGYPGVQISIDRNQILEPWEASLIMGSPGGISVAFFLMLHKRSGLGVKTVDRIHIFTNDTNWKGAPSIQFHLADV